MGKWVVVVQVNEEMDFSFFTFVTLWSEECPWYLLDEWCWRGLWKSAPSKRHLLIGNRFRISNGIWHGLGYTMGSQQGSQAQHQFYQCNAFPILSEHLSGRTCGHFAAGKKKNHKTRVWACVIFFLRGTENFQIKTSGNYIARFICCPLTPQSEHPQVSSQGCPLFWCAFLFLLT